MTESKTNIDLFEKYLQKAKTSQWVERALTDSSFKKEYEKKEHKSFDDKTNEDLSTYGDAVIKLCYSELMLDKVSQLTTEKAKFESDEYLVKVVAGHYKMLDYIKTDTSDKGIIRDYDFKKTSKTSGGNKKDSPHKYIATAVEAMIGAIYKEIKALEPIIELLDSWKNFHS